LLFITDTACGLDTAPTDVNIKNGRLLQMSLDRNGFAIVPHLYDHIDYYDESEVISKYYQECCRLVQEKTGAKKVYAFDHNIRSNVSQPKTIVGGNQVQTPVAFVHNDYTLTSAPQRVKHLGEAPKINDTLRKILGDTPLLSDADLLDIEKNRFLFVNVWRNITDDPVEDMPLALCDAQSFTPDDLITFEIRYEDRVGENYFVKHNPKHDWVYFPKMVKDEAILLKVWDSQGAITGVEPSNMSEEQKQALIPASFAFHTAFKDPTVSEDCPKRQSIECRLIAVY
jgi:hypothetical protein